MAHVFIDRTDAGRFAVRVITGIAGDRTTEFETHGQAEAFALAKMGKRNGSIVDTTRMSPAQLAAHQAHQARIRALAERVPA